MKHIIFRLALFLGALALAPSICFASTADQVQKATINAIDPKQDLLSPHPDVPAGKYRCTLWVNVPKNKNCVEKFRAVPYLTEPPVPLHTYSAMSEKYSDLKTSPYTNSYVAPQNATKHVYYGQGYRYTACLNAAIRELGEGPPHLLPEVQGWCERMYPHLRKFIVRSNEAEAARNERLKALKSDYAENRTEVEYAALKKGYYPIDLNFIIYHLSLHRAVVDLPEGRWWITGTHKVVGVTYYWQEPIDVGPDKPNTLELKEANALIIDSAGW